MTFNPKKFEEKTLSRQEIYDGYIIKVVKDEVSLPDGNRGSREIALHNGGVAVAPILDDKMLLVGQYRKALEQFIYEIPAGKLEVGEISDTAAAALRELEEETGYTTNDLREIVPFYVSPGFTSEKTFLYYTEELIKVENPRPKDTDEFLEEIQVTLEQAKAMIAKGQIADAKTIMAVWYWEMQGLDKEKNNG
ncbi:MAG: NUDIX hydrolase [Streptococcaceae bacterium]|nr:NUDIX hydrolase [Streptococcaceae bacterium]MCL2681620.1 NUDIX hydrolase [Streptococcaceae bacterium]